MKVIGVGERYEIYGDNLKTYDRLPASTYTVRFSQMSGFFLELHNDMEIKEDKVYGVHIEKVFKVLKSFERFNRNLGVILSGDKGIGKSLFARILSTEAIKKDIPVIIVDKYIPGIANYIESIEQEVMVLFDEFDKTFGDVKRSDGESDPQASLLSLFDGTSSGKKLFVLTCNKLWDLNDYLVNRPGRFHYHLRFDYPNAVEIREYLDDNLEDEYKDEIDAVLMFSNKVMLNYDCLRAIVFELNTGSKFADAIRDLNILNMKDESYDVKLHYEDGLVLSCTAVRIDMFSKDTYTFDLMGGRYDYAACVEFTAGMGVYNEFMDCFVYTTDNFKIIYEEEDKDYANEVAELKKKTPKYLTVSKFRDKRYRYTL